MWNARQQTMDSVKVLVVDDHPMVLEGMQAMLSQIDSVWLVGLASNAYHAMELVKADTPHVVITDISMPEVSGIELAAKIKAAYPTIKIIAMSTFNERSLISQMVQQGASGYLLKSASQEEIEEAILSVNANKLYMSLDLALNKKEQDDMGKAPMLTSREKEVLTLIAEGFTNPQIANKLFVSPYTVDSHRKNLLTKFNVNNTAGLIKLAARLGLV